MTPQRRFNILWLARNGVPHAFSGDERFRMEDDDEGETFLERTPVEPDQERALQLRELREMVRATVAQHCTPREEAVLWRRMEGDILEKIAEDYNFCRERIRQIERDAKRKLRKVLKKSMPGIVPGTGAVLTKSVEDQNRPGNMAREFVRRLEE